MSHNTFGHLFRVTTWGESHGPALGCVVDGCPPGIRLTEADIQPWLDRRRPQPPVTVSEVLVTATKRVRNQRQLAVAVTAIPRDELAATGSTDAGEASGQLGGVLATNLGPGRNKLLLRGLSDGAYTGRARSIVATYLDDIPINYNAPDPDLRLVDVERVEVARGPQGALYGAGSISGVYRIVARKPDLRDLSSEVRGSVSDTKGGELSRSVEGFVNLLTSRRELSPAELEEYQSRTDLSWTEQIALEQGLAITGTSQYVSRLTNSVIVAGVSTILSVVFGLLSAYAFSRFKIPGENDLLFFILSTRMLPPVVVTIPIFLMYRSLGLHDTHIGLIILYTVFNLSFSVWLLKGFLDEIPREYEEAALVDGYTRLQAFFRIVLPQAMTGIAATTVFCLIFAWNEYAFALMLTTDSARTAPPTIPSVLGRGGIEWATIAAGSLGFLIPVVVVTFALRKYLLRGVTFGAIRK